MCDPAYLAMPMLGTLASAMLGSYLVFPFTPAKGAVLGLMRATSGEFAPRGIRVNGISAGPIKTLAAADQMLGSLLDVKA